MLCLYTLYKIVIDGRVPLSIRTMHLLVWPLSVVLELLPLTTSTWYGSTWYLLGKQLCDLDTADKNYYAWVGTLFVGPLLAATSFLLFLSVKLWLRIRHMNAGYQRALVRSVVLYPCVTLLSCIPLLALFAWDFNRKYESSPAFALSPQYFFEYNFVGYVMAWINLQGFLNTAVFFSTSGESRERWHKLVADCWRHVYSSYCASSSEAERMKHEAEANASLLHIKDFLDDSEMEQAMQDQIREERVSHQQAGMRQSRGSGSDAFNDI